MLWNTASHDINAVYSIDDIRVSSIIKLTMWLCVNHMVMALFYYADWLDINFYFNLMKAASVKFNKKCQFCHFISHNFELRTIEQRHTYFHASWMPPLHFWPRTDCRGLLPKPNQEPPFCDMLSLDQLSISKFYSNKKLYRITISQGASILFAVLVHFNGTI